MSYAVPKNSLDFWRERFKRNDIEVLSEQDRFGDDGIRVKDLEGMMIKVVETGLLSKFRMNLLLLSPLRGWLKSLLRKNSA